MYNEQEDFLHHRKEIEDFLNVLSIAGIRLFNMTRALDIGAGQGMHAGFLGKYFQEVYCTDLINYTSLYNGEFYKLLKEKYERNGCTIDLTKILFIKSDGMDLLFKDNFFDMIISINTFEHIKEPKTALLEMIRCTKEGGYVYIQFDPIWTADTGSHFFHRVPEPWAHLVYSDEEYISRMKAHGASDDEVCEYGSAMNRKRLDYYERLFRESEKKGLCQIIYETSWSGLSDQEHKTHPLFARCLQKGFSENELLFRGARFLLEIDKTP